MTKAFSTAELRTALDGVKLAGFGRVAHSKISKAGMSKVSKVNSPKISKPV